MLQQILANGLVESSLTALMALGFALIYSTLRIFHVAHGGAYAAGAYACFAAIAWLELSAPVAMGLGVISAALFGVLIYALVYAPLARRGAGPLIGLISSLGAYIVTVNLIALAFGNENKTLLGGSARIVSIGGGVILSELQILQVVVAWGTVAAVIATIVWARLGTAVRAVRDNPALATITGTNVQMVHLAVMVLGSALAGLAAVLTAIDVGTDPNAGMPALLVGSVAMILGGTRTFLGPLLGALLIGVGRSIVVWTLSAQWADAVTFAALILVLVVRPQGLLANRGRVEEMAT